jgi:hypothetical protein
MLSLAQEGLNVKTNDLNMDVHLTFFCHEDGNRTNARAQVNVAVICSGMILG